MHIKAAACEFTVVYLFYIDIYFYILLLVNVSIGV